MIYAHSNQTLLYWSSLFTVSGSAVVKNINLTKVIWLMCRQKREKLIQSMWILKAVVRACRFYEWAPCMPEDLQWFIAGLYALLRDTAVYSQQQSPAIIERYASHVRIPVH